MPVSRSSHVAPKGEFEVKRTSFYMHEVASEPLDGFQGAPCTPGATRQENFIANLLYDMTAPGVDSISVDVPYYTDDPRTLFSKGINRAPQPFKARSNTIRVEVIQDRSWLIQP